MTPGAAPAPRTRALLPDLRSRSREPELLDAEPPEAEVRKSLADLRLVNRWLAGRRELRRVVWPHLPPGGRLLDVGCGSGDLAAYLCDRPVPAPLAVGLDIKALHLRDAAPSLCPVAGDVRRLPFRDGSFDVVIASHFLHHFDAPELGGLLGELARVARRAIVASDLRRALVPLAFARATFPLLFQSRLSVHDGMVSIRRGFREDELCAAFAEAGLPHVTIRRAFPYRLLAVAVLG